MFFDPRIYKLFANTWYFFCFTAKITIHITGLSEEERWQAKPAAKERKANEMGEFSWIHVVASDVYVSYILKLKIASTCLY